MLHDRKYALVGVFIEQVCSRRIVAGISSCLARWSPFTWFALARLALVCGGGRRAGPCIEDNRGHGNCRWLRSHVYSWRTPPPPSHLERLPHTLSDIKHRFTACAYHTVDITELTINHRIHLSLAHREEPPAQLSTSDPCARAFVASVAILSQIHHTTYSNNNQR